ncbi:MAG: non-homologous end-joining DNA ligase [Actinomycetota bacterium]
MKEAPERVRIGNRTLELSNLSKVFYPATGFTKRDVIDYYRAVGPVVVSHLRERPLTLKRYPDGVEGNFFYEKRCPPYRPAWIKTVTMRRKRDEKDIEFCSLSNVAGLVWTANLANLELHTSLARARDLRRPTAVVFDLDPDPQVGMIGCVEVALWLKKLLDRMNLESWPKTSGSKGLQIFVPLNTKVTYDETGPFALAVARTVEAEHPDKVITKMKKELRVGKVFIDWSQNDDHKTTVCVYSLRARERPTVSTPVEWGEVRTALKKQDPKRLEWQSAEVLRRIERSGDLFAPVLNLRQQLPDPPE